MAKTHKQFHALMDRVLTGSEEAAAELFREYEPFLLHAIRRRLSKRIRSKFDSLDFAQDVWASFYSRFPAKVSFQSAEELFTFLTTLARNKVIDAYRQRTTTEQYDVEREQSLDDSSRFDKDGLPGNQPTPSQILMTHEEWTEFLRKQPLVYRHVFVLLRDGKSYGAIGKVLGISARTVARIVISRLPGGMS
ncbi:MAG: sigma-70 family RNA polymerase sigma factor [Planctomycetes bacterium]|nr:sigma-70 family RNA polymerase sigma factor [Planctomycetota bacterium]